MFTGAMHVEDIMIDDGFADRMNVVGVGTSEAVPAGQIS